MSFHAERYGKNITLFEKEHIASRENPVGASYTPFGQGVTFTNLSIDLNIPVIVEILAVDHTYSGTLCIGLTNQDPESIKKLPTSSVPDFAKKPCNWGVALEESVATDDWVTLRYEGNNTVTLSINDNDPQIYKDLDAKIDFNKPVWGIVDVYGSVTKVRLLIPKVSSHTVTTGVDVLNQTLLARELLAPFDVRLLLFGDDVEAVRVIKSSLVRQNESGDDSYTSTDSLVSITCCQDWVEKSKKQDLKRRLEIACAKSLTSFWKDSGDKPEKSPETVTSNIVNIDQDVENRILRRAQFTSLKEANDVTTVTSDENREKPHLSIWEFSQECFSKSLHEVFIPPPITNPMTILYVLDYDKVTINEDNPNQSLFLQQFHKILRLIHTRVGGSTEEASELHKPYLSPPVIIVGLYDEKKLVDGQIEKIEALIRNSLEEKVYQPHVISLYHTIPHQGGEMDSKSKKMVDNLRKHLSRTAEGELDTGLQVPLWYHLLETNIKPRITTLSPKELDGMCSELNKPMEELKKAFHYLNENGDVITGYNSTGLFVYLEPMKIMGELLKAMTVADPSERWSTHDRMWTKLKKEGVLSETLLSHIWKDSSGDRDLMLDCMKSHHLLYEITGENETTRQFLIPSLLPEAEPVDTPGSNDVILYVDFDDNLPEYIFIELCLAIRQWSVNNGWGTPRITKTHCQFDIAEDAELTITCCHFNQSVLGVYIKSSDGNLRPAPGTVTMINDQIMKVLERKKTHHLNFEPTFCVKCSSCCCLVNLKICLKKSSVVCKSNHKFQTSQIQDWFKDTATAESGSLKGKNVLLTDKLFTEVAVKIGEEWKALGHMLGLTKEDLYHIQVDHKQSVRDQIHEMLTRWRDTSKIVDEREKLKELTNAMEHEAIDLGMLADEIKESLNIE